VQLHNECESASLPVLDAMDSVGGGRIEWIDGPGSETGLKLLIGSDPARAPRKSTDGLHFRARLRLIRQACRHHEQSDEREIEEAKASISLPGKMHTFKVIAAS